MFSLDDAAANIGLVLFELSFLPIRFLLLVLRMEGRALAFSSAQLVPKLAILLLLLPLTVGLLHFPANTAVLTAVYALANLAAAAFCCFKTDAVSAPSGTHRFRPPSCTGAALRHTDRTEQHRLLGLASADRLFLKKSAGLEQLGVYSMGISFGGAALLFQSIFSTVPTPYIFRAIKKTPARPPLGNGRIRRRPACLRPLPDQHFLAPRLPPAAGKLRCRPVYRRIV